jgi:hypothetical protein
MFDTPIALFIYKRPEETQKVFAEIAKIKPKTLLVVADGPKSDGESAACEAARAITEQIDWDCDVMRQYAAQNQGCRSRMASGIGWVFEQVEEAIILEDDCVPQPSFFRFCSELLLKYRSDPQVGAILGTAFVPPHSEPSVDYVFSRYFTTAWGWASWRRAWQHYDAAMTSWPARKESNWLSTIWQHPDLVAYWTSLLDRTYSGEIDTWDYQWFFSSWSASLLNIIPTTNLISNIGFGSTATHAKSTDRFAYLDTHPLNFPLRHPARVEHDPVGSKPVYRVYAEKAAKFKRAGQRPTLLSRVLKRLAHFA